MAANGTAVLVEIPMSAPALAAAAGRWPPRPRVGGDLLGHRGDHDRAASGVPRTVVEVSTC